MIVVENPYGGVGPELLPKLQEGKGYDLFRMMQYEASALGINMSVPYGAWMGSVIEDSFWAPHDLNVEIQDFITDNERLYSTETFSEVAVLFSIQSAYDWEEHRGWKERFPFWSTVDGLVEQHQPFDVVVLPEGEASRGLDHVRRPVPVSNPRAPRVHLPDARAGGGPPRVPRARRSRDRDGGARLEPRSVGSSFALRAPASRAIDRGRGAGLRGRSAGGHRPRRGPGRQHPQGGRQGGGGPRHPVRLRRGAGRGPGPRSDGPSTCGCLDPSDR